ncbi:MAG: fumarylacetoacetate hydrolase family protein [Sphingomonadales bacterium]
MTKADTKSIEAAAQALRTAHDKGKACAPLRDHLDTDDVAGAYAIQDANTEHWLSQGRKLVGRKIGLTAKAVQKQMGVDQPDYGMLFADMVYGDGEEIPMSRLIQPKVEGEIAFVLARDLDGESLTMADVIGAVDYALPAFEIVDSRITDWKITIADTVADNASSGLLVLGTRPVSLRDFDAYACGMVIEHKGEPITVGAGAACLGNPVTATLWLARKMVEVGRPLRAGDIVLSGALGPMTPLQAGGSYELKISGLGSVRTHLSPA